MKKIDDYKFISTAKGDKGASKNYSNEEFSKSDILFDTLGSIDELSSILGVVYHYTESKDEIRLIQKTLQNIGSLVATSTSSSQRDKLVEISSENIEELEKQEQELLLINEILPKFVLPGSDTSKTGAYFDLARSITRRTERNLVRFIEKYQRNDLSYCLKYMNRLSDLLFIYARSLS